MILINTEIAMMRTRSDLAIFEAMRYNEICMRGVHTEPTSVALTNPNLALEQPLAFFWSDRRKISADWKPADDINHYVKFYHPYAKCPLLIITNQHLKILHISCESDCFNDVLPVILDPNDLEKISSLSLNELMDKIYNQFPTDPDVSLIDVKSVIDRHTLKQEMITFG